MKLADWLKKTRTPQYRFANRLGVSAGIVSHWCNGTAWPERDRMEAIVRETNGEVSPNDFSSDEAQRLISAAPATAEAGA